MSSWEQSLSKEIREYIEAERLAAEARGYARAKQEAAIAAMDAVPVVQAVTAARTASGNAELSQVIKPEQTKGRMQRILDPSYVPPPPRGRNAEIVEELLRTMHPNAATPTTLQSLAAKQQDAQIASSSMRHALDQLVAKGTVCRVGNEWKYMTQEDDLKATRIIPPHANLAHPK